MRIKDTLTRSDLYLTRSESRIAQALDGPLASKQPALQPGRYHGH